MLHFAKKLAPVLFICCFLGFVHAAEHKDTTNYSDLESKKIRLLQALISPELKTRVVLSLIDQVGVNTPLCDGNMTTRPIRSQETVQAFMHWLDGCGSRPVSSRKGITLYKGDTVAQVVIRLNRLDIFYVCAAYRNFNVDTQNALGETCFHLAARLAPRLLEFILSLNPDMSIQEKRRGNTPLHIQPTPSMLAYANEYDDKRREVEKGSKAALVKWTRETTLDLPKEVATICIQYTLPVDVRTVKNHEGLTPMEKHNLIQGMSF